MDAKHNAGIAVARAAGHQRIKALRDHFRHQQRIGVAGVGVSAGEGTSVGGVRLVVLYHHIVRHQMNGIALNQERSRVVIMLFRRPRTDFTGLNQRRGFTQLAFVVGREEGFAEPRAQRIAEEIEIANPFRIRQRLMAGSLRCIAVDRGHRRQVILHHRIRELAEGGQQRDTRLLIRFLLKIVAAGLQPGLIRLGFTLFCVRELAAAERGGIALQRSAQLRQRLTFETVKRLAGRRWRHATGDRRRLVQRNLFRQSRQRQD